MSSRSEDEEEDVGQLNDEDFVAAHELALHFHCKHKISDESAVSLKKDYILSLSKDRNSSRVAAGLSNGTAQVFDVSSERGLSQSAIGVVGRQTPAINICGVRFLTGDENALLVGFTDGIVCLYDVRTPETQVKFDCTSTSAAGPLHHPKLTCLDVNANDRFFCVGTEQELQDVGLLFYDIRSSQLMGGYFESHQDDVTVVRFHNSDPDLLCTGSTDGLINIFDIKETSEDDALTTSINTVSSVHKLNWHKNVYNKDIISCITHTNDFKTYDCEGDLVAAFERASITEATKRTNPANCNLVNAHSMEDGGVFLLSGTNFKKGEILRSLRVQNQQLLPLADFVGNKQILRESIYDAKHNIFVTGGESGILSLWTARSGERHTEPNTSSGKIKSKTKVKSSKKTPYYTL